MFSNAHFLASMEGCVLLRGMRIKSEFEHAMRKPQRVGGSVGEISTSALDIRLASGWQVSQ